MKLFATLGCHRNIHCNERLRNTDVESEMESDERKAMDDEEPVLCN
jgi:hypothetical protein